MSHFFCKFYIARPKAAPSQNWQGLGPTLSVPGAATGILVQISPNNTQMHLNTTKDETAKYDPAEWLTHKGKVNR